MENKNLIIIGVVAVVLICLALFAGISLFDKFNTLNETNNTTNDTVNLTLNESNDTNATTEKTSTTTKKSSSSSNKKSSSSDPDSEVHESYFTVSENEKGQREGMEPGRYVEKWSSKEGPISLEKVS